MSNYLQAQVVSAAALATSTNTELLLCYSGRLEITYQTVRTIMKAWCQIVLSAATTGLITRIRRGNGITGTQIAGGNTQTVTASTTVTVDLQFSEQLINAEFADYSFTVQTVAASGASTINLAQIEVAAING